eukprot:GHVT01095485.1.p1 GENE.GHVT01095485.1~~GHVT01095485.1.p1  ORF type:complete len:226 (-),score=14.37 GHVT01095485.1:519-1196(-)
MSVVPPVNPQWFTTQRESPSKISAAGQKAAVSAASVPFVVDVGRLAASSAPPTGSFEDFQECLHWKATETFGNTSVVARHFKRRLGLPTWNRCVGIFRHWYPVVVALVLAVCAMYIVLPIILEVKSELSMIYMASENPCHGDTAYKLHFDDGLCLAYHRSGTFEISKCEKRLPCAGEASVLPGIQCVGSDPDTGLTFYQSPDNCYCAEKSLTGVTSFSSIAPCPK